MPTMNMIQAINDAHEVMMARDPTISSCSARTSAISAASSAPPRGCRRNSARPACSTRRSAEGGIVATAVGMARLWPAAGARDPVRRLHLSRLDQIVSEVGAAALPLRRRVHRADGRSARPTAAASSAGRRTASRPRACSPMSPGLKTVIPSTPLRRQGPADRRDRGQRSGHLLRAQAHLQRPVRRPSRPAGDSPGRSIRRARCPRAITPSRSARRRSSARARR